MDPRLPRKNFMDPCDQRHFFWLTPKFYEPTLPTPKFDTRHPRTYATRTTNATHATLAI